MRGGKIGIVIPSLKSETEVWIIRVGADCPDIAALVDIHLCDRIAAIGIARAEVIPVFLLANFHEIELGIRPAAGIVVVIERSEREHLVHRIGVKAP